MIERLEGPRFRQKRKQIQKKDEIKRKHLRVVDRERKAVFLSIFDSKWPQSILL